jgi:hypothetical protein
MNKYLFISCLLVLRGPSLLAQPDARAEAIRALEDILAAYKNAGSFSFNARYSQKFHDLDTFNTVTGRLEGDGNSFYAATDARAWLLKKFEAKVIYDGDTNYYIDSDQQTIRKSVRDTAGFAARRLGSDPNSSFIGPMISIGMNVSRHDLLRYLRSIRDTGNRVTIDYQQSDSLAYTVTMGSRTMFPGCRIHYRINTRIPCISEISDTLIDERGLLQIRVNRFDAFQYSDKPFRVAEKLQEFRGYKFIYNKRRSSAISH